MNQEFAYNILDILQTMWDAAKQMEQSYVAGNIELFRSLSMDLWDSLTAVQAVMRQEVPDNKRIQLADACTCAMESLKDIKLLAAGKPEKVEWKLAYELEPIIETAAAQFYYWGLVNESAGKEEFREFIGNMEYLLPLKDREEARTYPCDLMIKVRAYNQLDYTVQCVNSILKNIPEGIKTEVVLFNHGSKDDTKEYFENMESVRVINVAVNGIMPGVTNKVISRGKYCLFVSNDIVIGENAIDNLYRCAVENRDYGYIVPTTPAVSNLQAIPADYRSLEGFEEFAKRNNVYDPRRHEQRSRLCNPIHIMPTLLWEQMMADMYQEIFCNEQLIYSFPDDRFSLWMRRNGYKNILAKDAYCHHFGSVTVKKENQREEELHRLYIKGRENFKQCYNIDPWGTGSCYDLKLFEAWDIPNRDNVSILGLNCGIGGNSLKVKELLREAGGQKITLYNGTQEERCLKDLWGVSDHAFLFSELSDVVSKAGENEFYYVVVDEPIRGVSQEELVQELQKAGIRFHELAYKKTDGQWVIRGSVK